MEKRGVIVLALVVSLLLISSISLINAGLIDNLFGKITGRVVENETDDGVEPGNGDGGEVVCADDVEECSDGSYVSRNPDNDCEFDRCPPEPPEPGEEICCKITQLIMCKSCSSPEPEYETRLEGECVSVPGAEVSYEIVADKDCEEPPEPPPDDEECKEGETKNGEGKSEVVQQPKGLWFYYA